MSVERKTGERMIRHFVYLRGGHFIYLRGGSKFANISASATHAPRRGHLLLFECSLLPLEGSLSCCMKCRLQIFTAVFASVVDYAFIVQGPSPTSQGLSLMLPEFLPLFVCFVASVACCQVAKLPSCQVVSFFLLSSTHRIAHLLVKGFCMLPKFPVPDYKF